MPNTPVYGLPYPSLSEPPNGPAQFQDLAEAVELNLQATDANVATLALTTDKFSTGTANTSVQTTTGTTTSGSYTATFTGGTAGSMSFTAPQSGKILILNNAQLSNSSGVQTTLLSWELREGSVIGSGTVVTAASDDRALRVEGTSNMQMGDSTLITGLTAGASYNVRQMIRGSGGTTASASRKRIIVIPVFF